jgi:hypothetical protein
VAVYLVLGFWLGWAVEPRFILANRPSALRAAHRLGGLMVTWSSRKRAWLLITATVRRWHAKQWHMALRGSPSIMR